MEYVGGTSLNDLVKQRTAAGRRRTRRCRSTRPSPTWSRSCRRSPTCTRVGLLYCDFKPANVIQVGDEREADRPRRCAPHRRRRVADLRHRRVPGAGGRRATARRSPSDIYTVGPHAGRAGLRVQGLRRASTSTHLPTPEQVPLFAEHDSLYRLLLQGDGDRARGPVPVRRRAARATARRAARGHVARSTATSARCRRRTSRRRPSPSDELGWADLPGAARRHRRSDGLVAGRRDVRRPGATAGSCSTRRPSRPPPCAWPGPTPRSAPVTLRGPRSECEALLQADPWDWRAVWLTGVAALAAGDLAGADLRVQRRVRPGARRAGTEAGAGAGVRAGRRARDGDRAVRRVLADRRRLPRPPPSSAWPAWPRPTAGPPMPSPRWDASRRSAGRTAKHAGNGRRCSSATARRRRTTSLRRRWRSSVRGCLHASGPPSTSRSSKLRWQRPCAMAINHRRASSACTMTEPDVRRALESAYRSAARLSDDLDERIELVDQANTVRPRSLT